MEALDAPAADRTEAASAAPTCRRSREHWLVLGGALAVALGLGIAGLVLHPDPRGFGTHEQLGLQPCLPMTLWGIPCPGCGVTTSVVLAVHGRLAAALATQPFGLLLALVGTVFAVWAPLAHVSGRDLWSDLGRVAWRRLLPLAATALVLAWAYKLWAVAE
jgi:hypothetical protein